MSGGGVDGVTPGGGDRAVGRDDGPERIDLAAMGLGGATELPLRLALARLVCFPTDTVYGIGGPLAPATVAAIDAAKGRERGKPLQVVFPNRELLLAAVPLGRRLTDACLRLLPGPVTLVVPYPDDFACPPAGEVAHEERRGMGRTKSVVVRTLGVRVPRWPAPARLLETLSFPLVASSANRSGAPAPATLAEVEPARASRLRPGSRRRPGGGAGLDGDRPEPLRGDGALARAPRGGVDGRRHRGAPHPAARRPAPGLTAGWGTISALARRRPASPPGPFAPPAQRVRGRST